MTTKEMQAEVYKTGAHMRQEEYAAQDARGRLVGRHRWAVHDAAGKVVCRGMNPAQCFKRWQAKQEERRATNANQS